MLEKLYGFFLPLFILSIPIQLGKHFWPSFSFAQGIRVDYLSPILYISDIFALILIVVFLIENLKKKKISLGFKNNLLFLLFILVLLIHLLSAVSPLAHLYSVVKLAEWALIGFILSRKISRKNMKNLIYSIQAGTLFASLLAIWQFFIQHSVGGVFYFLGERTFSISTIGIAKMTVFNTPILRPYATFSHPNVLAFFLLASIVFGFFYLQFEQNKLRKKLLNLVILLSSAALLSTFSRIAILCLLGFIVYHFLFKKRKIKTGGSIVLGIVLFLIIFYGRFISLDKDLMYRLSLNFIALDIFFKNFLVGVGLNNFFIHEIGYQKTITPTLLQPVHNIYLLIIAQLGILGSFFPILFFQKTVKRILELRKSKDEFNKSLFDSLIVLLASVFIIGMFDHFFLTVQQGQIMLALLFGMSWTKKLIH